jgi:tetratricopeptide (TPR) repeat protein
MKSANPEFRLDEGALTFWADELITSAHAAEAIEVLKLDVEMHQESGAAYSSLADAYALVGQKQLAISNYRKSLEKDPLNTPAKRKIKELEESGSK